MDKKTQVQLAKRQRQKNRTKLVSISPQLAQEIRDYQQRQEGQKTKFKYTINSKGKLTKEPIHG